MEECSHAGAGGCENDDRYLLLGHSQRRQHFLAIIEKIYNFIGTKLEQMQSKISMRVDPDFATPFNTKAIHL